MVANQSVRVRGLEPGDFDAWHALWRGYQEFYKQQIPEETTAITWRRLLDSGEPMGGAVAVLGNASVGIVHWIFHRSSWTPQNYCYLEDLFVAPEQRGCGIGRKLIEHVYEIARREKCSEVYWLTHETNRTAMQLYDRIATRTGFVEYLKKFK